MENGGIDDDIWDDDGDTVVIRDLSTRSSVFPPFKHEDLPLIQPQPPARDGGNGPKPWTSLFEVFKIWIARVSRFYTLYGVGLRSVATAAAGGVAVAFTATSLWLWVKRWPWRRRRITQQQQNGQNLKLLIKEKDQRINQLLLQIAQMNEILSGRRRVPVFRVG